MHPQAGVGKLKHAPPVQANGLPVVAEAVSPAELFPAFVHNLDGIHHGVLPSRDKTEDELALCARLQALERLVESPKAARFLEDVEVSQQDAAVEGDVEQAFAGAPAGRALGAKPTLAEFHGHNVAAVQRHRNGIREIPEPLILIQRFVVRTGHRVVALHLHSAVKITVAAPESGIAVCIARIARQNSNRADYAGLRWRDFDAVLERHLVVQGGEFQVQDPIVGRTNVLEYLDIGGVAAGRVGSYVEVSQQFAAIGADSKNTGGFPAAAHVVFAEDGFGKIQPQLVDALLQGNVVGEIALPPV